MVFFFKIRFEIYCCSINLGFGNILIQISTFKYRNSVWKITNLKKISIGVHDAFNKLVFFLHSALCTQIEAIIWMMLFFLHVGLHNHSIHLCGFIRILMVFCNLDFFFMASVKFQTCQTYQTSNMVTLRYDCNGVVHSFLVIHGC